MGYRLAWAGVALSTLVGCPKQEASAPDARLETATRSALATSDSGGLVPARHFVLDGERLGIGSEGERCFLERENVRVSLDLRPPCHFLLWLQEPPLAPGGPSDGRPVGKKGDIRAWRYGADDPVLVLAVVGDPVPERLWRAREAWRDAGFRCGARVQPVLIRGGELTPSAARPEGLACVESGLDEKMFWVFAHPEPSRPRP